MVLERYQGSAWSTAMPFREPQAGNNLVNFALLKTIGLKDPVRSGQQMADYLGRLANEIGVAHAAGRGFPHGQALHRGDLQ